MGLAECFAMLGTCWRACFCPFFLQKRLNRAACHSHPWSGKRRSPQILFWRWRDMRFFIAPGRMRMSFNWRLALSLLSCLAGMQEKCGYVVASQPAAPPVFAQMAAWAKLSRSSAASRSQPLARGGTKALNKAALLSLLHHLAAALLSLLQ